MVPFPNRLQWPEIRGQTRTAHRCGTPATPRTADDGEAPTTFPSRDASRGRPARTHPNHSRTRLRPIVAATTEIMGDTPRRLSFLS